MEDLIKIENGQIQLAQVVIDAVEQYEETKMELELQEGIMDYYKEQLRLAMEKAGLKSVEIPVDEKTAKITYVAPGTSTKRTVDYAGMKEKGIYDTYVTETQTERKSYVKVSLK